MAQMVTRTFDDLRAEGHRGEFVYVTDQGGTKVCGRDDAEAALFLAALFGGIGGGVGAAIGAAIRPERVLYAAPSPPSAHAFELRVAPGVIGLRAQLRF